MSEARTRTRPEQYPWERRLGARVLNGDAVEFRVWAPRVESVGVRLRERDIPLDAAGYGVHEATVSSVSAGEDYRFVVDDEAFPDPCSRWQPEGLRGPSRVFSVEPPA